MPDPANACETPPATRSRSARNRRPRRRCRCARRRTRPCRTASTPARSPPSGGASTSTPGDRSCRPTDGRHARTAPVRRRAPHHDRAVASIRWPSAPQWSCSLRGDVDSDEVAGEAVSESAVDRRLTGAEARQHLSPLPRFAQAALHHLRQQAPAGVRGQHADPRVAGRRDSGATGNRGVEPERTEVADASITVPRTQPVAVQPRRLARCRQLVARRTAQQRGSEGIGGLDDARAPRRGGCRSRSSPNDVRYRALLRRRSCRVIPVRRRGGRGRRCRSTGGAACSSPAPRSGGCAHG